MEINFRKTKEIFCSLKKREMPAPICHIEQVTNLKLLGMYLQSNLKFDYHIGVTKSMCMRYLCLIKQVKNLGASTFDLKQLYNAWILSRLLYCSTVYVNLTTKNKSALQSVLHKAYKWGFVSTEDQLAQMLQLRDKQVFSRILDSQCFLASG